MTSQTLPPGPKGHLLLGNMLPLASDPLTFLPQCAREYGDAVRFRIPGNIYYMFSHPDAIEAVLRGNHRHFIKDHWTRELSILTGKGLLTSEGDFWRRQRQMAQPAFQRERIQKYAAVMVEFTDQMLAEWHGGEPRKIHRDMMRLALRIVTKTLFAADADRYVDAVGHALDEGADYFMNPLGFLQWLQWLPLPGAMRYRRAVRQLDRILYDIVRQRKARRLDGDDLLGRLLTARDEQGGRMTDLQLRDELMTLFLAGHETTALVLTYAFHLLARDPEADARLFAELQEVLNGRLPTAADVPRLAYTSGVIHESMRLYPPAWSIGREAIDDCEIADYPVPKGTQIILAQWVVHRDPRWFDEPDAFRPERWQNDLLKRLPRGAYFPFGDGPRVCIGNHFALLEATLILATVAQRFRLTLAPGPPLELVPSVTLRPKRGPRLIAQPRQGRPV